MSPQAAVTDIRQCFLSVFWAVNCDHNSRPEWQPIIHGQVIANWKLCENYVNDRLSSGMIGDKN